MERILIATGNAAKQAKLRWLIDGLGFEIVTPADLGLSVEVDESDPTHREVAEAKARAWSAQAQMLTIASDGGARVPALGARWNSLFTRRAAGPGVDDIARTDHLLSLMQGMTGADRRVAWVEGVAVARDGILLASWQADGSIGSIVDAYDPSKIGNGFWFPALIWVSQFGKVQADLTPAERDTVDDGWNELYGLVRPCLAEIAQEKCAPIA
jgi:XTP/dITP diphosphohydrolase